LRGPSRLPQRGMPADRLPVLRPTGAR
jgi:hypothetical protein